MVGADLDIAFKKHYGKPLAYPKKLLCPDAVSISESSGGAIDPEKQRVRIHAPDLLTWRFEPVGFKTFCEAKEHMHLMKADWMAEGADPALSEKQYEDCMAIVGDDPKKMFDPATRKYVFGALLWAKGCIDGATKLFDETTQQKYTVKDIVDRGLIISIKAYDEVSKKIVVKTVARVFSKGMAKRIRLKFKSGREIIVSPDHRFFDGVQWVKVKDLLNAKKKLVSCKRPD